MPRFRTRTQAMNQRKHSWVCLKCNHESRYKMKLCEACHSNEIQYFPSNKELRRYRQLRLMLKMGAIESLKVQVKFPIIVKDPKGEDRKICDYIADFQYVEHGQLVTEDAKGHPTPEFLLKAKLVKALHGVDIKLT